MTDLTLDAMHATLDADPCDQYTRARLGDYYLDLSEWAMADGMAWMAAGDFFPVQLFGQWGWFPLADNPRGNALPPAIYDILDGSNPPEEGATRRVQGWKDYHTRRSAEEALCRALAKSAAVAPV